MEYGLHNIVISGVKAARKANDVLGIFKEEAVSSEKPHHSYYEPETPSPTSNIPSYFSNLTANLPKKANSVKVQNLRSDQVILPTLITLANALNMMIPMLYMMNHTPQDYMTVSKQCRQSGKLWEDPAFPANSKVLTDGNMIVSYFGRRQVASFVFLPPWHHPHQVRDNEIQWMRPRDICRAMKLNVGPAMIVGERDR